MATFLKIQSVVFQVGCLAVLLPHVWVTSPAQAASFQPEVSAKELAEPDVIPLELPPAEKLLPMGDKLPPIRLEASYTEPISLREALVTALENNLAIGISKANLLNQRWLWIGSLGRFLPNALMNYDQRILSGSTLVSGVIPVTFHNPNVSTSAGFQMFGFQGGRVLFGALTSKHNWKASKAGLKGSINDVLLQVSQLYYGLLRHQALLEIQSRAVEVSRAQLDLNNKLERAGTGTRFNVLQSETQLARDEQNLLVQEVALRQAAIQLAAALNINLGINLLSAENEVRKVRLIDPNLSINELIRLAVLNRPELKQYEQLRLAAKRNIQVVAAALYPQFQFFGSVAGNGATLTNTSTMSEGSFSVVPIDAPIEGLTATNNIGLSSSVYPAGVVYNPATVVRRQVKKSYALGLRVDWNYLNLGVPDMANVQAAKAQARVALLQANQQLINVMQQVRQSYLNSQTAERLIDVTSKAVISATEQLRLARVRLANGVGTNIDVIEAQRDYITALVNKADAIIQFNNSQAQLVHDIGLISVDNLISGRLVRQ